MATKKPTPPVALDASATATPVVVAAPAKAARKPRAKAATPSVKAAKAPAVKATPVSQTKPVKKTKAAPAATVVPKAPKEKLVRDSFTMPRSDFALIDQLKERALAFKRPTKKSELLRAGLQALAGQSDAQLKAVLAALIPIKAGRPKSKD